MIMASPLIAEERVTLHAYQLVQQAYINTNQSLALPKLELQELATFLKMVREIGEIAIIKRFRPWLQP